MNWHDLAFYDADLFESLRKLIYQSTKDPNYLKQLDMTFEIVDSGRKIDSPLIQNYQRNIV